MKEKSQTCKKWNTPVKKEWKKVTNLWKKSQTSVKSGKKWQTSEKNSWISKKWETSKEKTQTCEKKWQNVKKITNL